MRKFFRLYIHYLEVPTPEAYERAEAARLDVNQQNQNIEDAVYDLRAKYGI